MFLLYGCKKDDFIEVSGLMTDPNHQMPVEGVTVEVWTQKLESGIFSANFVLGGTEITLSDGRFHFQLENLNYTAVKLIFFRAGYFGWETTVNSEKLKNEHSSFAEYQILPKAWIRFRIINTEPFDAADYFEFRLLNGFVSCEECCKGDKYQFTGVSVNQDLLCQLVGHQDVLVQWSRRKNGEQIFKTDKHFISAFDTTVISFEY